jgi:hypothetical protein
MIPVVLLSTVVVSSNHVLSCACPQTNISPAIFIPQKRLAGIRRGESIMIFSKSMVLRSCEGTARSAEHAKFYDLLRDLPGTARDLPGKSGRCRVLSGSKLIPKIN